MAESYSVRAILSAVDKGFTAAMRGAQSTINTLGSKIKGGLGFGVLTGAGIAAFNGITNSCRDLITEMNDAKATWKTFNENMSILGKSDSEIKGVKKELEDFAVQTIYSSSDMASTYAQLAAVGTKSTLELVKGFGGLAAAAEDPKQAMKTLSTQATQMAARPKVAWEDFKLMLEQSPAGMAAVAREMGMSAQELTNKIQAGEVATEDFFAAIEKAGTSDAFSKMAREYKTAEDAMAGLSETLTLKFLPAYSVLDQVKTDAIESVINSLSKFDGEKFATKLQDFITRAGKYMKVLKEDAAEVGSAFGDAFSAIGDALSELNGAFGSTKNVKKFSSAMDMVKDALVGVANFLENNASVIAFLIKNLPKLVAAFVGLKVLSSLAGGLSTITNLFGKFSSKTEELGKKSKGAGENVTSLKTAFSGFVKSAGLALIIASLALFADSLTGIAKLGTTAVAPLVTFGVVVAGLGATFATFGSRLQASAIGIAVFAAAVSVMALTMAPIADAGKEGAVAMAAFGIVVAGLVAIFAIFGPALNAAIPGMLGLGAAALMVGEAMNLASSFISTLPPVIRQLGDTASQVATAVSDAFATICDGAATVVDAISGGVSKVLDSIAGVIDSIGTAAANAGIGFERVANGIETISSLSIKDIAKSLGAVAAGMAAMGESGTGLESAGKGMQILVPLLTSAAAPANILSSAFAMLSASIPTLAVGFAMAGAGLETLNGGLSSAVPSALVFGTAILLCSAGVIAFSASLQESAATVLVVGAALGVARTQMIGIVAAASSAGTSIISMQGAVSGASSSLTTLAGVAKSSLSSVSTEFRTLASTAKTSGKTAGSGFTSGLKSGLSKAPSMAATMVSAVTSRLRSGYSAAYSAGAYISQGFAAGMRSCLASIRSAAASMVAAADAAVKAKAKIASPSKLMRENGRYFGEGFELGITDMTNNIRKAAERLVAIPNIVTGNLTVDFNREVVGDWSYSRNAVYVVEVPLTVDGKEFARATATYTQDELERQQNRANRKHGIL